MSNETEKKGSGLKKAKVYGIIALIVILFILAIVLYNDARVAMYKAKIYLSFILVIIAVILILVLIFKAKRAKKARAAAKAAKAAEKDE